MSFGSGAMTNSINEISKSACILVIGSDTSAAHPVIALEIIKAVRNGSKLIVANPKEIDLRRYADIWLRNLPGSDVALLMGMMKVILDEKLADTTFVNECCENFDNFSRSLIDFDLNFAANITSVSQDQIAQAARLYATCKPASIIYAMGITQHSHGTNNVLSIANLAMLTGNMGKPSTGVNPLRGQNNVQGACDMGGLPTVFTAYQRVDNADIQKKFEAAWGYPLNSKPGLTLTEIFDEAYAGNLKAIYLIGENPVVSDPDINHIIAALNKVDFLIVQDSFLTETAQLADVVLPATTFAEKDGTFTNTERRVQRVRQAISPIGNSKPDWLIICQIAQKMGYHNFNYDHPSQIMKEIARLTPSYGGISYQRLEQCSVQWPCPTPDHPGTPILHMTRFVCGLGKFSAVEYKPPAELPDKDYPLTLITGRNLYHFHTGTMTRKVSGLNELEPEGLLEINPIDAAKLQISNGQTIKVISRRGNILAKLKITDKVPPNVVYMAFHFAESAANILTSTALDPVAKIPELKVCTVRIEGV
jgi:formate dehydrogenase alpha subunit